MLRPQSPVELKVKAASLAAEARIIRKLEQRRRASARFNERAGRHEASKAARSDFWKLRWHRVDDIRPEARATHLARTFLRGQPYKLVEQKTHSLPPLKRAGEIAAKYADGDKRVVAQRWEEWKQAADRWALDHLAS